MQLKPIAVIVVLSLIVASLTLIITQQPPTAPTTTPAYPNKRLNYGQFFGRVSCEPGWQNGTKFLPTNGSSSTLFYDCNGTAVNYPTDRDVSNQKGYMVNNGWSMELSPTSYMLYSYPTELATLGPGHTQMDAFKNTYVALMDKYHMKWWLEISDMMNDQSKLTYQTPGYTSLNYTPTSGMAKSYESTFGPALDFIEHNCSTNFQGYSFEQAYTNGVVWLHNRTNYSVSEKDWSGWQNNKDSHGVNVLMGTNLNGTDISPMPTPLQRVGLLDEVVVELFNQQFFTDWATFLPQVRAAYPNTPIVMNVDQVCAHEAWKNGAPFESGYDSGWWAPQGVGEPNNRCHTEELGALQRIYRLEEINGKPFDGMIYNFVYSAYPEGGWGVPDITWFLQWADTLYITNPVQTPQIQVSVDGGSIQSLNFGVTNNGSSVWVVLQLYAGGNVANLPNATVTFNVTGTSISKTTADNTIFFRLPTSTVPNPDPPGFLIRLSPGDLAAHAAGNYGYTLVVTTSYGVEAFNGSMTVT
ncbi:MAG: hypothetical protein ACXV39_10500 [Halobacteriota archaeon]